MHVERALLAIGILFLAGLLADEIGRRTRAPRVTLLILVGLVLGPAGIDALPGELVDWYEFLAAAALTMVAFLLGGALEPGELRAHGREILWASTAVALTSTLLVSAGLMLAGLSTPLALLFGGISTATAPAATRDVVRQSGADGPFARRLLGIVAIDDAWGLIVFGLLLAVADALAGNGSTHALTMAGWELGGSILVGAAVGAPAAVLTGRLRPGEPMLVEALGVVFVCAGLAIWTGTSFLLAGMTAGMIVASFASHHDRPFHEIENVEWPFMVLFFILAGALLEPEALGGLGLVGAAYVGLRLAGRIVGGWIGGRLAGLGTRESLLTGVALTPQAGVAVGMALIAGDHFPEHRDAILSLTLATTVVFELFGPPLTLMALRASGEARRS